jgi:hypothetical protein
MDKKQYYQMNKEKIKQQAITWRKNNKEIFLAYQRTKQKEYRKKYPLRQLYRNIKSRCENLKDKKYKYYGGKSIKCLLSKEDLIFLWNRDNANLMRQASIDRIDSKGNYELNNCRFIEMKENRIRRD